ncbi:hypothetical protein MANY_44870 [Mycolicibacterium anyangense]|uniref:PIN domain-containing protein n=1 Tax=Mycolicibacterium anyangense TaxID=1431246 RepID=A0A6N4WAT3_9MYCO|nr:hypothetical protein MANY_44870 [Mycolicibacterium anyangense]
MVVDWAAALIKVAPPAGQMAAKGLRGFLSTWIVAYTTRRQAKKRRLGVLPYWQLRKYLSTGDALEAFASGESARYHAVGRDLVGLYKPPHEASDDGERQSVEVLLRCYTRALSTNEAVELQGGLTAQRVSSQLDERDAQRFVGEARFEENLQLMPPHRAAEARELKQDWPAVVLFVHEFVASSDRASALRSWHQDPPAWFQVRPSSAIAWFARVANDYGVREVASAAFDSAIEAGATPPAYWRTRQILMTEGDVRLCADALKPYAEQDTVARVIVTAAEVGNAEAAELLRPWDPQSTADKSLKCLLLSQLLASDDLNEAITLCESGFATLGSGACGTLQAQFQISRGTPRRTALDFADLERALEAALKARDAIRMWGGPSGRAVELAITAARLLGRDEQARSLAFAAPDGNATLAEAETEGVRRAAASLAAESNRPELARSLANSADPMTKHEVEALIAVFNEDRGTALTQLLEAIEHAVEPHDLERLSLEIALQGVRAPQLAKLAETQPDTSEEIGLVADAYSGNEEALSILRTRSRSNRLIARALIGLMIDRGETKESASIAEVAGENWSDPELELFAAELHLEADDLDSAVACADKALYMASPRWVNARRAYNVLIQAHTGRRRWGQATTAAMAVLAMDPNNVSAVWAVTVCQHQMGQIEQAWKTYTEVGGAPPPRQEIEALVRIDLWTRFEQSPSQIGTLTSLLDQFPQSRQVKAAVTNALLFLPLREDGDSDAVDLVRRTIAPLLEELQDIFIQMRIDEDDPRSALDELVRELPDTREHDQKIEQGKLPLGVAATIHRKSLTEVLSRRTDAPIFSGDSERFDVEVAAALGTLRSRVVVDLTALYTLSVLEGALSDRLLGCFLRPEAARAQVIDAIQGIDSLAGHRTMRIGRAPDGSAFPMVISTEEAVAIHARAQRIRAQFDKLAVNDTVAIGHFPEIAAMGAGRFAWIAAVDHALETHCALWCDDRMTRRMAAEKGIHVFSTHALLEALRRSGELGLSEAVSYQSMLVAQFLVGLDFRDDWLTRAAQMDGWKPRGAATYIAHCGPMPDAAPLLDFVMHSARGNLDDPESLSGWIASAAHWLVHVAGNKGAAQTNLVIFLSALLQEPWLESSKLPFVLKGIRDGIGSADVGDPLKDAMTRHYRLLAEEAGWVPAAQRIHDLVALTDVDDRVTAAGVVLLMK